MFCVECSVVGRTWHRVVESVTAAYHERKKMKGIQDQLTALGENCVKLGRGIWRKLHYIYQSFGRVHRFLCQILLAQTLEDIDALDSWDNCMASGPL